MSEDDRRIEDRPLISPRDSGLLIQGVFMLIFGICIAILFVIDRGILTRPLFAVGAVVIAIATGLLYLPGFRSPWYRPWMIAIPLLDFLAIVIIRLETAGGATNPMILMLVLPAIAIGLMKSRWAIAALVPAALAIVVPDMFLVAGGQLAEASRDRALMVIPIFPLIVMLAAGVAYVMTTIIAERQSVAVTAQRRRDAAASETERTRRLFEAVLDELDVGVAVMSPDGGRILMNRVLRESPSLTADGGDPWESFMAVRAFGADRVTPIAEDDTSMRRVMRGERVHDRISWVGAPGDEQMALSVSATPVHSPTGEHLANVIRINNVTAFLQAIEAKDAFIATVSHELRTPLTTLSGFLELILDRHHDLDDDVVGWLRIMERNLDRQQVLVRDLLSAAGSRSMPLALERRQSDLAAIAREAAAALRGEASAKGVRLTVRGRQVEGVLDPARFAQVAENLIANAVRYTPEGGRVGVLVRSVGDELVLTVTDTGIGISADDQKRLFEQFFRGDQARSAAIRGVGLGLPIVKSIVDAHGGVVEVDSALGCGTTVTVRIPRSTEAVLDSPVG